VTDDLVMYLVARSDLGMSPGKLAAQVGHGVQLAMRLAERMYALAGVQDNQLTQWERNSYPKVVLGATGKELMALCEKVPHGLLAKVIDEGRTEIPRGTYTCVAFVPMLKSDAQQWVKRLRLYK
jgi:peptidyl-tRNA hydrolase, PTH2 family